MQSAADSSKIVDDLARRAGRLFSLPAVAVEVLRLTEDPGVEAAKIKECIEKDPAITVRILRVVNSSLFGPAQKVDNLGQAVAMLGIKPLKMLVLGFSLPPDLFADIAADQLRRYWLRTLTKAVLCRGICQTLAQQSGDEAFLTGLLSDIGQLVLIQELGEPYTKLLEEVERDRLELATVERHALGIEHASLSAAMLRQWAMPELFYRTIEESASLLDKLRSEPEEPLDPMDYPRQAVILAIAELLTQLLTSAGEEKVPTIEWLARSLPAYTSEALKETVLATQKKVEGLAEIFSVRLPDSLCYEEVIEQAFHRMSDISFDITPEIIMEGTPADMLEVQLSTDCMQLAEELRGLLSTEKPALTNTKTDTSNKDKPPVSKPVEKDPHRRQRRNDPTNDILGAIFEPADSEVNRCRNSRQPLSLMLVEQLVLHRITTDQEENPKELHRRLLEQILERAVGDRGQEIPIESNRWAILLPGFERRESVELGGRISQMFTKTVARIRPGEETNVATAIGVSMVDVAARNFETGRLITAAVDCLHASVATDGGIVKSIEVY